MKKIFFNKNILLICKKKKIFYELGNFLKEKKINLLKEDSLSYKEIFPYIKRKNIRIILLSNDLSFNIISKLVQYFNQKKLKNIFSLFLFFGVKDLNPKIKVRFLKKIFHLGVIDYIHFSPIPDNFEEIAIKLHFLLKIERNIIKLQSLILKDELTGLFNRRMINLKLKNIFYSRDKNHLFTSSFILLDIDFFKKINDQYGHSVGDAILKQLGRLLIENFRLGDFISRYGGEEFLIILQKPFIEAKMIMERFRLLIQNYLFKIDSSLCINEHLKKEKELSIKITISIGISYYIEDFVNNEEDMIDLVDLALFYAKNYGKNQTVLIPESLFIV